jgi:hypothetical protein
MASFSSTARSVVQDVCIERRPAWQNSEGMLMTAASITLQSRLRDPMPNMMRTKLRVCDSGCSHAASAS